MREPLNNENHAEKEDLIQTRNQNPGTREACLDQVSRLRDSGLSELARSGLESFKV